MLLITSDERAEMTPFFSLFPPKDRGFVFFIDNHQPETIKLLCEDHVFKTDCAFFIRKQWVIVEYKSYIHASSNTTHNATVGNRYRVTSTHWASRVWRPGVFSREHLFTWISCCFLPFKCWSFCHDRTHPNGPRLHVWRRRAPARRKRLSRAEKRQRHVKTRIVWQHGQL